MLTRRRFFIALLAVLAPLSGYAQKPQIPTDARVLRDVPYVTGGHVRQRLDLYLPPQASGCPLAIWIHGGGWEAGNKDGCPALGLLAEGYAVASLNYRLSQHAPFPAQIEDCKAAIRWLRAHAKEYGIAPGRVGVWGASAGGHLTALLATTGETKDFDVGENLDQSSAIQCAIDWFGPSDFLRFSEVDTLKVNDPKSVLSRLFGGPIREREALARAAGPVNWAAKTSAPLLIMHGTKDPIVPLEQSQMLADKLQAAGAEVKLDILQGAAHGGKEFFAPERLMEMKTFFDRYLKPSGS